MANGLVLDVGLVHGSEHRHPEDCIALLWESSRASPWNKVIGRDDVHRVVAVPSLANDWVSIDEVGNEVRMEGQ